MFPLNFNSLFRKSNGELTTLGKMFENSGGGSSYTLPTASASTKGGVKIGSGLTMNGDTLKNNNPTPYILPTASASTKGGVKVGSGLTMDGDILKNTNPTPYDDSKIVGDIAQINSDLDGYSIHFITGSMTSDEGGRLQLGIMRDIPLSARNVVMNISSGSGNLYTCLPPYIYNNDHWVTILLNDDLDKQISKTVNVIITYWTK